jgi:hypothetical protein
MRGWQRISVVTVMLVLAASPVRAAERPAGRLLVRRLSDRLPLCGPRRQPRWQPLQLLRLPVCARPALSGVEGTRMRLPRQRRASLCPFTLSPLAGGKGGGGPCSRPRSGQACRPREGCSFPGCEADGGGAARPHMRRTPDSDSKPRG